MRERKLVIPVRCFLVLLFILSLLFCGIGLSSGEVNVKVGDEAPDFSLEDPSARTYRLSDFRGKNAVVLEFFRSGDW